jgi:hypothetical protein
VPGRPVAAFPLDQELRMAGQDSAQTGTRDETYDVVSVLYHALKGAQNCEKYCDDAEDDELREFFEEALDQQRELADRAKDLLGRRLQGGEEQQDNSAFFGSDGQSSRQSGEADVPAAGSAS